METSTLQTWIFEPGSMREAIPTYKKFSLISMLSLTCTGTSSLRTNYSISSQLSSHLAREVGIRGEDIASFYPTFLKGLRSFIDTLVNYPQAWDLKNL